MPRGRGETRGKRGGRRRSGRGRGAPSPIPIDARGAREAAELGNASSDNRVTLAANYDRAQRKLGFGVGAGDPYSLEAENKEQLANRQRGIGTTAGNQLYSGATLNARSAARSTYDKNQKDLEDKEAEARTDYTTGSAQTTRDEQTGAAGIKGEAIERKIATEPAPRAVGSRKGRGRPGQPPPPPTNRKKGRGR